MTGDTLHTSKGTHNISEELFDPLVEAVELSLACANVVGTPRPQLDRFVVTRVLGAGGMGIVLRAYDPKLERSVAIKLIRTDRQDDPRSRARILREAKVMARFSHPNVVQVYEVAEVPEGVFIAMELVDGENMHTWLRASPRSWRSILDVFMQAGRGLEAAHAVGIVHRDFKPANIFVGDERVRVGDFGLARSEGAGDVERQVTKPREQPAMPDSAFTATLTAGGKVMGTPAYMAPEQHRSETASARTDQFAFCVSVWECLFGEHPFRGNSGEELRENIIVGHRRPTPRRSAVPLWVRRALERGLAVEPDERHSSMATLLGVLGNDPSRRRWTVGLGLGFVAAAMMGFGSVQIQRQRAITLCGDEGQAIDDVWNEASETELRKGLASTGVSFAAATADRVVPWLDDYAASWRAARVGVCQAVTIEQTWDAEVGEAAEECLYESREQFASLLAILSEPGEGETGSATVRGAVHAATALPAISHCEDMIRLAQRPPLPNDEDARRELRVWLAKAAVLEEVGRYEEAMALAERAQARADTLGWQPLRAAAALQRGSLYKELADFKAAEEATEFAFFIAGVAKDEILSIDAAHELAHNVANRQSRFSEGLRWIAMARMYLDRAGVADDDERRADNHYVLGMIHREKGDYKLALKHLQHSLAITEMGLGPDHPELFYAHYGIGEIYRAQGLRERATAHLEHALVIGEQAFGLDHPSTTAPLCGLGHLYTDRRMLGRAVELCQRALTADERTLGPEHPDLACPLTCLGRAYKKQGLYDQASKHFQRALNLREQALGADHFDLTYPLISLAYVCLRQGSNDQAIEHFQRSLRIREKARDADHPDLSTALNGLGWAFLAKNAYTQAIEHFQRALSINEGTLHADDSVIADSLTGIGITHVEQGDPEKIAQQALERALALREKDEGATFSLGETRFALARALWPTENQRSRAHDLVELARDDFRTLGDQATAELAETERWLEEHKNLPSP